MLVLDVSSYNTGVLPPCDGIIARVTNKDGCADSKFYDWCKYALNNKKMLGAYKYTYATSPVIAEIESINVAKHLMGVTLPLGFWLDCETPTLRTGSDSLLSSVIAEYKETMELYRIPWGGVYCDYDFYEAHVNVLANENLWLARWLHKTDKKPTFYGLDNVKGWQYTNRYNGENLDASLWKVPEQEQEQEQEQEKHVKYNPDNVRKLQEYLNKHYGYALNVDGVMGTNTFTAICQSLAK